jgi:hypothetical protein
VLDADATKEDGGTSGGVTTAFDPLRAAIETGGWFASARAGWGMSGGQASVSSTTEVDGEVVDMWEETIDGEGLPKLTLGVGELEVGARRDRWEARASVERSLFPTFDGNLALEERASGSVAYAFGRRRATRVKLSPFAARTWTWTRDAGSSYEESVGASVHAGHALREQLRIDAIGEAGVTPYARLDGVRDPEARLGGRVLVALSAFVSR